MGQPTGFLWRNSTPNASFWRYDQKGLWNICDWKWPVNVKYPEDEFYQKDFWRYTRK